MESSFKKFRVGILGAGGFSHFSVDAFLRVPGVSISGVYDLNPEKSDSFGDKFKCRIFKTQEELLADPETEIIYIATPPYLHYQNSKDGLLVGKHVICEKPAGLKSEEVVELMGIANKKNLLYVVNLMQRYNPLFHKVKCIVDQKTLGEFLHGYFENYASDESLDEEHWMWDEKKSGGIFIEHAVHFFDLIEGWLGKGELVASQKNTKQGLTKEIWPEVQAICKYRDGLFNFYHGFHQANRMDRQELKLIFELGDITLHEWVPTTLKLHGLVNDNVIGKIKNLFPEEEIKIIREFSEDKNKFRSNFKDRLANFEIIIETGQFANKYNIYRQLLTDMLTDQIAWIKNRDHQRVVTDENGLNSLIMAETANNMAIKL